MAEVKPEILFPKEIIHKRVGELAGQISRDYDGRELLCVGILKGAFIFAADLIRGMSVPCRVDFVRLASYGVGSRSSGEVRITKDLETPIGGRDVLIVEDIIDTGLTLSLLVEVLRKRQPASLRVCTLLDKKERRGCLLMQIMWVLLFPMFLLSDTDLIIMKISVFFRMSACFMTLHEKEGL